ncbi:MAG: hypothetical protein ACRCYY_05130 [Trueperaceae bacterium]
MYRWLTLAQSVKSKKLVLVLRLLFLLLSLTIALAGGEAIDFNENLGGLSETVCNAANFIYGPIGWSLALLAVAAGVVMWFTGTRGGVGTAIAGVVGIFVMLALPGITEALTFGECALGEGG